MGGITQAEKQNFSLTKTVQNYGFYTNTEKNLDNVKEIALCPYH